MLLNDKEIKYINPLMKRTPKTLAEEKAAAFGFSVSHAAAKKILAKLGIPADKQPQTCHSHAQRVSFARMMNSAPHKVPSAYCPAGHVFTVENTYIDANGARHCRRCLASCF